MRGTKLGTIITVIFVLCLVAIPVSECLYRTGCIDFGQRAVLCATPEEEIGLPEVVEVGELVRINISGKKVVWDFLPRTPDYESYGTENENLVISFREAGTYTIIVACQDGDEVALDYYNVNVVSHTITKPDEPTPQIAIISDLESEVVGWCEDADLSRAQARELAKRFQTARKKVIRGDLDTPGKLIKSTFSKTKSNETSIFFGHIQAYTLTQEDFGEILSLEDYADLWGEIAEGLLRYASL